MGSGKSSTRRFPDVYRIFIRCIRWRVERPSGPLESAIDLPAEDVADDRRRRQVIKQRGMIRAVPKSNRRLGVIYSAFGGSLWKLIRSPFSGPAPCSFHSVAKAHREPTETSYLAVTRGRERGIDEREWRITLLMLILDLGHPYSPRKEKQISLSDTDSTYWGIVHF